MPLKLIIASRTLRDSPEILEKIRAGERLERMAGIEEPACKLVEEYLGTGKIQLYEEIKSKYSEEMLRFIRISGLGKKRIFAIYDTFNIRSLEELKDRLSDAAGFTDLLSAIDLFKDRGGQFYARRLKQSLDYIESIKGRFPRWQVEFYLDKEIYSKRYRYTHPALF